MFPTVAASLGSTASGLAGGIGSTAGIASSSPSWTQALGGVGMGMQGASGLAQTIMGLIQMGKPSTSEHMAQRQFERMQEPVGQYYQQLFFNPMMQEGVAPYSGVAYRWAPTEATKQIYSSYLNRQYGVPESIASGMRSQAMQPFRMGSLAGAPATPAGLSAAMRQDPGQLAQAMLNTQAPDVMRQQDYLTGAGQLAAYNLWRMQQLPQLIG